MYTFNEHRADSERWLQSFGEAEDTALTKVELWQDTMKQRKTGPSLTQLQETIDELEFQLDLVRGVNGALRKHIARNRAWMASGKRLLTTDPLDTSLEE